MTQAPEVLLPVYVTMLLGYGAAWHGRFGASTVPVPNKVVLLYAVAMSISAGILRLSRGTLTGNVGLVAVLILGLAAIDFAVFAIRTVTLSIASATQGRDTLSSTAPAARTSPVTSRSIGQRTTSNSARPSEEI
jgi:hypothetical protein